MNNEKKKRLLYTCLKIMSVMIVVAVVFIPRVAAPAPLPEESPLAQDVEELSRELEQLSVKLKTLELEPLADQLGPLVARLGLRNAKLEHPTLEPLVLAEDASDDEAAFTLATVRWETPGYASLQDGEPDCLLPADSQCELLRAYATDVYHMVRYNGKLLYVPAIALDITDSNIDYVFDSQQDMRTLTGFTGAELEYCLKSNMSGLGEAFAQAEADHGVNALFMVAIAQHESGHGESGLAVNKHNLIGLRSGSGWASFSSDEECIDFLGGYLMSNYLMPEGGFYHGSTISGVCATYCGGSASWIRQIAAYMEKDLALIEDGIAAEAAAEAQQ